jgi:hypothetical protein
MIELKIYDSNGRRTNSFNGSDPILRKIVNALMEMEKEENCNMSIIFTAKGGKKSCQIPTAE